jgi:hypothetical protein
MAMKVNMRRGPLAKAFLVLAFLLVLSACAPPQSSSPPESAPEPTLAEATPPVAIPTAMPTPIPAIPEARRLTVEWPPDIKVGDSDIIRMTLDVDTGGNMTVTAQVEGNETRSETVSIPNLYETHNVMVEARMDLAGVQVSPAGEVSEPLLPGEPVSFSWSVKPEEVGTFRGTIWVHLRFFPKDGGPESRRALSAQLVEVRAVNFLGLGGSAARWLGGLGTLLGSFISFDSIIPWVVNRLRKRKGK